MPFEINIVAGKDQDYTGTLEDANGNPITIASGSDVLWKAFRGDAATPDLDVNGTALAGGTVTTFSTASSGATQGQYTIKFFGADTSALNPQTYDVEVDLVDNGDSNRDKIVDRGVLHVLGGSAGKTT